MDVIQEVGSYAGFAAVVGLAVLAALYFSQARDLRRLREWAGRAPERAAEQAMAPEQAAQEATRPAPSGAVRPIPAAKPATPGKPDTPGKPAPPGAPAPAVPAAAAKPATATGPGDKGPKAPVPATAAAAATGQAATGQAAPGSAPPAPTGPAPATPAGAPAKGAPAAPAKPDGAPPVPAVTPALPPRPKPPVVPPRPAPPVHSPAAATSQSTAVLPASRVTERTRRPGVGRTGLDARYVALIVAGVIVVGGGAVFGISQLGGDDDGGTSSESAGEQPAAPVNPSTVTVSVLNGTTVPGLAAQIGDEVETAGFQRGNVANALDQQRTTSVVLFVEGADREARIVARKLGISDVEPIDPDSQALGGSASVVVIVGADQTA